MTLIVPDLSVLSALIKLTALEASASGEISRGAEALAGRTGRLEPEVKAKAASDEVKRLKAEAALLATHEDVEPLRDLAIGGFKEGVAKRIDDLTERSHRDREELEGQVGALALLLEGIGSALEASGASLDAKASEARNSSTAPRRRWRERWRRRSSANCAARTPRSYPTFASCCSRNSPRCASGRRRRCSRSIWCGISSCSPSDVDPLRERAEEMARRLDESS